MSRWCRIHPKDHMSSKVTSVLHQKSVFHLCKNTNVVFKKSEQSQSSIYVHKLLKLTTPTPFRKFLVKIPIISKPKSALKIHALFNPCISVVDITSLNRNFSSLCIFIYRLLLNCLVHAIQLNI